MIRQLKGADYEQRQLERLRRLFAAAELVWEDWPAWDRLAAVGQLAAAILGTGWNREDHSGLVEHFEECFERSVAGFSVQGD